MYNHLKSLGSLVRRHRMLLRLQEVVREKVRESLDLQARMLSGSGVVSSDIERAGFRILVTQTYTVLVQSTTKDLAMHLVKYLN